MKRTLALAVLVLIALERPAASESIRGCFIRNYDKAHMAVYPDQVFETIERLIVVLLCGRLFVRQPSLRRLSNYGRLNIPDKSS